MELLAVSHGALHRHASWAHALSVQPARGADECGGTKVQGGVDCLARVFLPPRAVDRRQWARPLRAAGVLAQFLCLPVQGESAGDVDVTAQEARGDGWP